MLRIMLQKMWHKRWMNLSLLLGCILLVATVVSFPLYQKSAYDRLLNDEFKNHLATEGTWPTMTSFSITCNKERGGSTIKKLEDYMEKVPGDLGLTAKQTVYSYNLTKAVAHSEMNRSDVAELNIVLGGMSDIEKHVQMLSGELFSETGIDSEGRIEVIVSQDCLVDKKFLVGETIAFDHMKDAKGKPLRLVIKGVFEPADSGDFYWQPDNKLLATGCLMPFETFREMFTGENAIKYSITANYSSMYEYEDITSEKVETIINNAEHLKTKSKFKSVVKIHEFKDILENYILKQNRISATLVILQVPVLVMLAAFLFMISGQMYEMEKNEISVIKSRGSSGGQIFRLYLYQGLVLTITGSLIGVPLGTLFSRILGSTRNFLEFDTSRSLNVVFTDEAKWYLLIAMAVTLMSITLPAIKHSRVTIVNLKQQKALKKKALWEKLFIDIILLGVSFYGYYSFNKNSADLSGAVLTGESLDPLLYISSSVFIVGAGLFFLRIQPYIIKLIYIITKRRTSPAGFISFQENIKNTKKQHLIMLFLIMTISLGMFHATVARTILQNAVDNTAYKDGADVIIQENWPQKVDENNRPTGEYKEPDFSKYATMDFAAKYTKVLFDNKAFVKQGTTGRIAVTLMGIHTKEFGQITNVDRSIIEKHYYTYLNELAENRNGILVSKSFANIHNYKVGDSITYSNERGESLTGTIVDFFDYFPGYAPKASGINPDGTTFSDDQFLIVGHYDVMKNNWGVRPYEIWVKLNENADNKDIYNWIEGHNLSIKKYTNRNNDIEVTMEDPLLQGTNGVLTMGFAVTIILCGVGYLIFWVMSIRERELIFGVLRACGFHKREIFHLLINEQIFSGLFSVAAGIGIGKLTSFMFVPILQTSYASKDQMLPMKLITEASDMYKLYGIIGAVMALCLVVLVVLLFRMNVTKALKLGEE